MSVFCFFFFLAPATPEIYTLSLHDALPICEEIRFGAQRENSGRLSDADRGGEADKGRDEAAAAGPLSDRKSTRLNSSHGYISYAVFCLKKKKTTMSK